MSAKRVLFIDYAKGIGILLMLFQHSIPQHNLWRLFIQAFVMPLFFIIGGYIWQLKDANRVRVSFSKYYLQKRIKQLAPAYLIGCFVLAFFYEVLSITQGDHSISHNVYKIISLQGIDSMWFIPVFFLSESLFLIIIGLKNKRLLYSFFVIVLLALTFLVRFEGSPWPFALLEKTLMGCLFFIGGYLISKLLILDKTVIVILLLLLGLSGTYVNGFASFAELHYPILYLFDGLALSVVLLAISKHLIPIKSLLNRFILFYGRETLLVLCSNNIIIEIIRLLDYKISGNCLLKHGMIGNVMMFLVLTFVETVFLVVYKRFRRLNETSTVHTP